MLTHYQLVRACSSVFTYGSEYAEEALRKVADTWK